MADDAKAEPHLWIGVGMQRRMRQREQAAHCSLPLERANCPSPVRHEAHARKNLERRKEGAWFGSLLWQSLQKRTDIVLEDQK